MAGRALTTPQPLAACSSPHLNVALQVRLQRWPVCEHHLLRAQAGRRQAHDAGARAQLDDTLLHQPQVACARQQHVARLSSEAARRARHLGEVLGARPIAHPMRAA
jgi:hypothetical protein